MRVFTLLLLVRVLLGCAALPGQPAPGRLAIPSEISTIDDLAQVRRFLASSRHGQTLLVLDIDDTLLTSAGFFGSDAWYDWQRGLLPGSPGQVPCRFDVMGMNFEAGTQVTTQPDAVEIINSISTEKIILTARSDLYRSATLRELKRAGYDLPKSLSAKVPGINYDWQGGPVARPIPVSYRDGVFMVSGQDKGILLLDLLRKLGLKYDRVVLVDDGPRNIDAMRAALASAGVAYHGFQYGRVDKTVDSKDVQEGIDGWRAWQQLLSRIYPERMRRLQANICEY